jgi:hypothetical protein
MFPIWQYLNQPILDAEVKLVLNPKRFWKEQQIEFLTRCWEIRFQPKGHPYP